MLPLLIAILFTLGVSAFCSLLEAMVLSLTTSEIEHLKISHKKKGFLLQEFKSDIEETSSAILALNTIANTLGSVFVGGLATQIFGDDALFSFSIGMSVGILIFSEIIPKNIGVLYRVSLMKHLVFPLQIVRAFMAPLSYVCKKLVKTLLNPQEKLQDPDKEITLLAEKGAKDGQLTKYESDMVANTLSLDDTYIYDIMTPRTVISGVEETTLISELLKKQSNLAFGRMPVYENNLDNIKGIVRRRDIFSANASQKVQDIMKPVIFIPETAKGGDVLQQFLKHQQQFAVVVDEFGSTSGVITMEDIFEHILGKEIFEKDDMAVDMRILALKKKKLKEKKKR